MKKDRLPLTVKYELEEEIARLCRRVEILERSNEDLKTRASIMCSKTFRLLRGLGMSDRDIYAYYRWTGWNK